jgi:hypothetical protein
MALMAAAREWQGSLSPSQLREHLLRLLQALEHFPATAPEKRQ